MKQIVNRNVVNFLDLVNLAVQILDFLLSGLVDLVCIFVSDALCYLNNNIIAVFPGNLSKAVLLALPPAALRVDRTHRHRLAGRALEPELEARGARHHLLLRACDDDEALVGRVAWRAGPVRWDSNPGHWGKEERIDWYLQNRTAAPLGKREEQKKKLDLK